MKKLYYLFIFLFLFAGCSNVEEKDAVDLSVDSYVADFIENNIVDYVNYTEGEYVVNVYVLEVLNKLKQAKQFDSESIAIDEMALSTYFKTLENTPSNLFKKVLTNDFFALDQGDVISYSNGLEFSDFTNVFDMLNVLYAFEILDINNELRTTLESYVLDINNNDYVDSDYAAGVIIALADKGYDLSAFKNFIIDNLSAEGVESWGNKNSASTAMAILAFIALGENPREILEYDAIEILLGYKQGAAFKWVKEDQDTDLIFSTPQSFAALAAYKLFSESEKKATHFQK